MKTNFDSPNSLLALLFFSSVSASGMCLKKNRFHMISALDLYIPLATFNQGVDAALAFSSTIIGKNLAAKTYASVQNDCLTAHNQFRMLVGAAPLKWSSSAQAVAQKWANNLANSGLCF